MKRTLSLLLTLVMIIGIFSSVPMTVSAANKVEEGLSSVATVEQTAYGVLDTDVVATRVTLGDGYYLNSRRAFADGYVLVEDEAGTTFYLVGTKGVVKSFYSDSGEKPTCTQIHRYSIDSPYALYSVYNPETEKYDVYNANTCQYFEYGLDDFYTYSLTSYEPKEYAKNIIKIEKNGKYGLINNKGQMLYYPIYEDIYDLKNCFIGVYMDADGYRRYAVLSNKGTTSGTKLYDNYLIYDDILFAVSDIEPNETWDTDDNMDWALVNTDLTLMTDFIYYDVQIAESNDIYYRVCSRAYEAIDAYGDTDTYLRHQVISDKGNSWDVCQKFNCISSAIGIYHSSVAVCENGLKISLTDDYGYYDKNSGGWINPDLIKPNFNKRYILAKPNGEVVFDFAVTYESLNEDRSKWAYINRWESVQGIYGKCEYRKEYPGSKYVYNLYDSKGNLIFENTTSDINVIGNYIVYNSPNGSFIYDYINEKKVLDNIYINYVDHVGYEENGVCFAESEDSGKWAVFDATNGTYTDCLISATDLRVSLEGFITNGKRKLWICEDDDKYIYVNDKGAILSVSSNDDALIKNGDCLIKKVREEKWGPYGTTYQVEIIDYDGKVIKNFNRYCNDYGEADVYVSTDSDGYNYGLISQKGETIIDDVADSISVANGLNYVEDGDYAAVVDNFGNALMYGEFDDPSAGGVGNSGFTSFIKDNEVYIYNFASCNGFDENIDSSVITEDDLFGKYSAFLNNGFYNSLTNTAGNQVANTLSHYGENARAIAFVKSALDDQTSYVIEKLVDFIPGSSINETKAKQEMALEYLNSLDTETTSKYLKTLSTIRSIASKINDATKLDYDLDTEKSKVEFIEVWTDGTGFSSSEVYKVIDEVKNHQDRFDDYYKSTGRTIDILEYVSSYLTIYLLQRDLVKSLMDLIPQNSDLYEGLNYIYAKQSKSGTVVTLVAEMLTDEILDSISDLADEGLMKLADIKNTNIAALILYVGGKIAATAIDSPKLEDIDKVVLAYANMITLKTAVNNYQQTIADNYSNGGAIAIETLKSEYSLLCDTYYKAIFAALKYAKEIAPDNEKTIIARHADEFEKKLIYRSYIKTCLLNARTQWEYTVQNNKAVITKLKAEYPSGEGRVPYMELYNSQFDVDGEMDKTVYAFEYAIDVPATIDGYQVSAVGINSFSENNRVTGVYIPDTVTEIQDSAFKNCSQINTVYLGSSVESIGDGAFENCNDLYFVDIPDSVCSIGEKSFANVEDLIVVGSNQDLLTGIASNNVITQTRDLSATELEIITQASKTEFNMQEEIDSTGLAIRVTYSDGSTKVVSEGFYADILNRVIGENSVVVSYEGLQVEYNVNILASQCNYTVSYQDEQGNVLADSITGTATAGSTLALEIPKITGYVPVNKTQTEVVGYDNNFVVKYTETPKISIDNATVTVENQYFAYENLTPNVAVELDGVTLIQGRDFTVAYADNYYVGTGMVIIIGEGNYDGMLTTNFKIIEKAHDWSQWYIEFDANVHYSGLKYRVCACCQEYDFASIPQLKPSTPKLTSVTNTASGTKVTWNAVTGADDYIVYRKTYSAKTKTWGGWSRLAINVTSTSYTDKTAKGGTYYVYTVKANNEAGYGGHSSGLKIKFLATPKLTSIANNTGKVTVKWNKVSGATGYIVYRRTYNASTKTWGGWSRLATTKSNTYNDTTAKSGVYYRYTVRAYYGDYTSYFHTTGLQTKFLATPTLKTVASNKTGVKVTWGKVAGAKGYNIYRKTYSGGKWTGWSKISTVKSGSTVTITDKTAKKGVTYRYTVRAISGSYSSYFNTTGLKVKDKY